MVLTLQQTNNPHYLKRRHSVDRLYRPLISISHTLTSHHINTNKKKNEQESFINFDARQNETQRST
jgi:hypothetical protein